MVPADLRALYTSAGQGHVFNFIDKGILSQIGADGLIKQLRSIDPHMVNAIYKSASISSKQEEVSPLSPVSDNYIASLGQTSEAQEQAWYDAGLKAVYKGKVASVIMGGGQGTRLGFDGPKGMYNIGLPSGKSLYQLQAERLQKVQQLAKDRFREVQNNQQFAVPVHSGQTIYGESLFWYIMTSPLNHETTLKYLQDNAYFGMQEDHVILFQQGTLPCLTSAGLIILEEGGKVAQNPAGNGGIYPALVNSGALAHMEARGIECIQVSSVDNALIKPIDPVFIGACMCSGADIGSECVWRASVDEKVGVMALRNGRPCIVEYSEMKDEERNKVDDTGRLVFGAGNICCHFFKLKFIKDIAAPALNGDGSVVYHYANKKIPFADPETGVKTQPTTANGIKLEGFIFDVFPLAESMFVLEINREDGFAPVKNAPGESTDSPDTARMLVSNQAIRWATAAGATVIGDQNAILHDYSANLCEISPTTSLAGEGLEHLKGHRLTVPFAL